MKGLSAFKEENNRMPSYPLSRTILTTSSSRAIGLDASIAFSATLVIALCAHTSLPLPFSPIPITLQNFAVVLLSMFLGPRLGVMTMTLYLAEGLLGFPVFSPQGPGGVAQLLGPTGGFLLSYPFAAAIAGLVRRSPGDVLSAWPSAMLGGLLATVVIFLSGASWLAIELHLSAEVAWSLAVAPFLGVEAAKLVAAATIYSSAQHLRRPR